MREKQTKAHPQNHFPIRFFWRREIIESTHTNQKHITSENTKRTCETWQLKLSSGGGTYGIHPPPKVVFFERQQRSFRPKNILLLLQRIVYLLSLSLRVFLLSRILLSALFIWRESLRERRYFFPHFFSTLFFQNHQGTLSSMTCLFVSNETLNNLIFFKNKKKFKNKKTRKKEKKVISKSRAALLVKRSRY